MKILSNICARLGGTIIFSRPLIEKSRANLPSAPKICSPPTIPPCRSLSSFAKCVALSTKKIKKKIEKRTPRRSKVRILSADCRKATCNLESWTKVFDSTRLDACRPRSHRRSARRGASRGGARVHASAEPFTFLPRTRENSIFRQTPIGNVKRSKEF